MSFVYAEKFPLCLDDETVIPALNIFCDTKVTLPETSKLNWGVDTLRTVAKYGIAKTIIVSPSFSISFAGNELMLVTELFDWMEQRGGFPLDELVNKAFELHLSAKNKDDVEFIICALDDSGAGEITCIKEGALRRDVENAWIGSPAAFRKLQEYRLNSTNVSCFRGSRAMFEYAVRNCGDESVGGMVIEAGLHDGAFCYATLLETHVEREHHVEAGCSIPLFDDASAGGFTICASDCDCEPVIDVVQANITLAYTKKYRYEEPAGIDLSSLRHFLLPMLIDSSSGKLLPA